MNYVKEILDKNDLFDKQISRSIIEWAKVMSKQGKQKEWDGTQKKYEYDYRFDSLYNDKPNE